MQALELCADTRLSEAFVSAPSVGVALATCAANGRASEEIYRRIDNLTRVRTFRSPLRPRRERDFWHVIDNARLAAERRDADTIAAAVFALDLLSLELCDE